MAANPDGVNETAPGRDIVTPETRLEFDEVVAAVEALPEGQRLVVQLVCVNGFSYSETASILGSSYWHSHESFGQSSDFYR